METMELTKEVRKRVIPIDNRWAIDENYGFQALESLSNMDIQTMFGSSSPPEDLQYAVEGGVAILTVSGPLTKEPTCAYDWFGGTSTVQARKALRRAFNDVNVKSIMLKIDSPGGQADGTSELANEVRRIANSGTKSIVSYIDGYGASAAYWIACQANSVYSGVASTVGSIGTYMVIRDTSVMAKNMGVKVHVIRAGAFKGAGTPGTELTKDHIAKFQRSVDAINGLFKTAVQSARGFDSETMEAVATGETWLGNDAAKMRLTDGVMEYDDLLADMQAGKLGARTPSTTHPKQGARRMSDNSKATMIARVVSSMLGEGDDDTSASETEQTTVATATPVGLLARLKPMQSADQTMVTMLAKAGVADATDLEKLIAMAKLGEETRSSAIAYATKQATRYKGAEWAGKVAASLTNAAMEDICSQGMSWETLADEKWGHGKDGTAPARTSGSANLPGVQPAATASAEGGGDDSTARYLQMTTLGRKTMAGGVK